jgi:thiamine biosynthesis lipoprotein
LSTLAMVALLTAACVSSTPELRTVTGLAQGTTYSLQWLGGNDETAIAAAARQELERLDALLSNYRPDSTLERFNAARTTEPVELPRELVALFELAKAIHMGSNGCFDPTVLPLVRAWGFDSDEPAVPLPATLEAARAVVGLDKLELLDATHARKTVPDLEFDMASIGQGYSVERLADLLEQHGSSAYLVEIGGEVAARGTKPGERPWRVGVENPAPGGSPGPALRMPATARTAVITSGTYRHYFEQDERRFGHIIDPRTGWPVEHSLVSVTVVGDDAATAAAWATALLCLGPDDATAVAERHDLAALWWVEPDGEPPELRRSTAFVTERAGLLEARGAD